MNAPCAFVTALAQTNAPWLIDVVQSLLVVGLVVAIWKCPVPGREWRPAKELFRWGARYPLVFGLLLLLSVIIWGVFGRGYGLQDLFFHESPGVQLLSGMFVSAIFLSVVFLQHVFDRSRLSWLISLEQALEVLGVLPSWLLAWFDRTLMTGPGIGLDRRLASDLEFAVERSRRALQKASEPRDGERLELDRMDAIQTFVVRVCDGRSREVLAPLVALVNGIAVVILIGLVPCLMSFPERLPWLLGVIAGWLGAARLAAWAVHTSRPDAPLEPAVRDLPAMIESAGRAGDRRSAQAHRGTPLALRILLTFFALRIVSTFWGIRDLAIGGAILNRSLEGLLIQGVLAVAIALGVERVRGSSWFDRHGSRVKMWVGVAILVVAASIALWRIVIWGIPFETDPRAVGAALVFAVPALLVGVAIFALGTRFRLPPGPMLAAVVALALAAIGGSRVVPQGLRHIVPAILLSAAALAAGATLVSMAIRSRSRRALAYPAAILGAYATVALLHGGLSESSQAMLPSALSVATLVGVLTTTLMTARAIWPEYGAISEVILVAAVFAFNGNAWLSETNAFKLQFPEMQAYYGDAGAARSPVFLDTRAYFRSTMPGVVRLRHAEDLASLNRQRGHGDVERLATVTFGPSTSQTAAALELAVLDERNQLRLRPGDRVELVLPEVIYECVARRGDSTLLCPEESAGSGDADVLYHDLLASQIERATARVLEPGRLGIESPLLPARHELELAASPDEQSGALRVGEAKDRRGCLEVIALNAAEGSWLAVSPRWSGVVIESGAAPTRPDADKLVIRLENLPAISGNDARWTALRRRIEQGHLIPTLPSGPGDAAPELRQELQAGECLIVEHQGPDDENPRHVETLVEMKDTDGQRWGGYTIAGALDRLARPGTLIHVDPARGLFRGIGPDGLELAGARRCREGDRLLLRWSDEDGTEQSLLVKLATLGTAADGFALSGVEVESGGARDAMPAAGEVGEWQRLGPLDNFEVLESWKRWLEPREAAGREKSKPALVIVTLSGGGIRASVWTATVLEQLEALLGPRFPYHIRLVTGASGGMVAGAYYTTTLQRPHDMSEASRAPAAAPRHVSRQLSRDQLNSVAGALVFSDFPGLLNPLRREADRGRRLEQAWIRLTGGAASPLARPLQSYAADEWLGWRPSLVFTPMMVEDGRRLLISNLDLSFVTRNIGGMLLDRVSEKIESVSRGPEDRSIEKTDDIYSMSAVEFFRLFPDAHAFRVSTAVRMSASFPFISPAVSLPTQPPRRVVDAGYYDNYGVNLASLWLDEMYPWLVQNTSGVLIIQIRDHVSQKARTEMRFDQSDESATDMLSLLTWDAPASILEPGFQPLVTPLHGIASARQWSMSFRNDEQVELLDDMLEERLKRDAGLSPEEREDFFRTVVFECPVEASLSWTLSQSERRRIQTGLGTPAGSLDGLKDYTEKDAVEVRDLERRVRRQPVLGRTLERLYRRQLEILGCARVDLEGRTWTELKEHYTNLIGNRKRLQQLDEWWRRRTALPP
jgi:hypothetical protein